MRVLANLYHDLMWIAQLLPWFLLKIPQLQMQKTDAVINPQF